MVFNSFAYLVFFTTVVVVYFTLPLRYRWLVILLASYVFYAAWSPLYSLLLVATTILSWLSVLLMERMSAKRPLLFSVIAIALIPLFFFKYFDFVSSSLWTLHKYAGEPFLIDLLLPVGISFYTFQVIAYMLDVYRGDTVPERNFFRYATFVSFFPHLVAGPILRPGNILPQVREGKRWSAENFKMGLFLIGLGLIKKVVIADRLGIFVNDIYLNPELYSGATLLVATYFFAFQIYCDFSGYTDIAIGSARILGYTIPDNFRQPYFSGSITEFWRRWHISLSSWLRDYVYIPLGGNRKGDVRTYVNLLTTMLIGGLWHGAAWTFVIWGFFHGVMLTVERFFTVATRSKYWALTVVKIVLTFNVVSLSWIFFRAESVRDAFEIIRRIATEFGSLQSPRVPLTSILLYGVMIAALLVFDYCEMRYSLSTKILRAPWYIRWGLAYGTIFFLIFFAADSAIQFIYFQF